MENSDIQKIINVDIEREVKKSFMEYAVSVLVGRALPDVRDGLKPVHRRILYTMHETGLTPDKAYRKSVTAVGDVLGKYHPHGEASVYDAMVRMAQDFSHRYPLVDGHGNFGSIDGDPAAAYRYTEARLARLSLEMLKDIDKETVAFMQLRRAVKRAKCPLKIPQLAGQRLGGHRGGHGNQHPAPQPLRGHRRGGAFDRQSRRDDGGAYGDCARAGLPDGRNHSGALGHTRGLRHRTGQAQGALQNRYRGAGKRQKPHNRNRDTLYGQQIGAGRVYRHHKDKRIEGITDIRDESNRAGIRIVVDLSRTANAQLY